MKHFFLRLSIVFLLLSATLIQSPALAEGYIKVTNYTIKVQSGDTLYSIAKRYNSTVLDIQKANRLTSTVIKLNQLLIVPVITVYTPTLNSLPTISSLNASAYPISGTGVINGTITFTLKDAKLNKVTSIVKIDSKGKFSTKLNLQSLADGTITLESFQKDTTNHASATIRKTITKDSIGPTITLKSLPITFENQSAVPVSGTISGGTSLSIVFTDGATQTILKSVSAANGTFSSLIDVRSLKDGNVTLKATSSDALGNKTTKSIVVIKNITPPIPPPIIDPTIYELSTTERTKWGIYNDGTHPLETTKGFNDALKWASANGKTTFKVPDGTYLIAKGTKNSMSDPIARINLVSNMTFQMSTGTIIQKETNGFEIYDTIFVGPGVENVIIRGGTVRGDKDTHDYSQKGPYTGGTHEWGNGVAIVGAKNVLVENVKSTNFSGDGMYAGATTARGALMNSSHFETGGLDENGQPIAQTGKIRSKIGNITDIQNPIFQQLKNLYFWLPEGVSTWNIDVFFYRLDGSFISSQKAVRFYQGAAAIPEGAASFRMALDATSTTNVSLQYYAVYRAKQIVFQNNDISFSRRQGISIVGAEDVVMQNNKIHDIKGIAPQSAIDLEGGFYVNNNIIIKKNIFTNNAAYHVILYDGKDAIVEDNYMGPGGIGLAISQPFRANAIIKNNTFDGSSIASEGDGTFIGNTMKNSMASLIGANTTVDGMIFIDSQLSINSSQPFGIEVKNVTSYNNEKVLNPLSINGQPVHISNLTMNGKSAQRNLVGNVADGSIFDNLKIIGYNSTYGIDLPRGTYNNCYFEAAPGGGNALDANDVGTYTMNGCTFKGNRTSFTSFNTGANITIQNSSFDVLQPTGWGYGVIDIGKANNALILNNVIHAEKNTDKSFKLIHFGINNWQTTPVNVKSALVKGNTLYSLLGENGVHTLDSGIDAGAFSIEDNVLHSSKLMLRPIDLNTNNQELTN